LVTGSFEAGDGVQKKGNLYLAAGASFTEGNHTFHAAETDRMMAILETRPVRSATQFRRRGIHACTSAQFSHSRPSEAQLSFRQFIEALRRDNDIVEIDDEIDPHLEAAAIVRRVSETDGPAPLINKVKGAERGLWRIFGNSASLRSEESGKYGRIALALGLEPKATWKELTEKIAAAGKLTPLKPVVLPTGPCKENFISAEDINLHELPIPQLHDGDGGKYMQTYGIHVLQTPDKRWTNWSIFRGMVHDRNHLCCLVGPSQHNSMVRDEWRASGAKEMPWALALGVPPAANLVAALPLPKNVSEGEIVSALLGEPMELVKCDSIDDLLVPASSEIVLEGAFLLEKFGMEGPFGDFLGMTFDGDTHEQPLFRVDRITYRDDAILPISVPGRITDESVCT
jgi:UbiD family decarboxylase